METNRTELRDTAVILQFPVKSRIVANKFAEQARRSAEISARRTVEVAPASGWYHDAEIAREDRSA